MVQKVRAGRVTINEQNPIIISMKLAIQKLPRPTIQEYSFSHFSCPILMESKNFRLYSVLCRKANVSLKFHNLYSIIEENRNFEKLKNVIFW